MRRTSLFMQRVFEVCVIVVSLIIITILKVGRHIK
jgi:hypothetical protein